jgi:protein SCO1/2
MNPQAPPKSPLLWVGVGLTTVLLLLSLLVLSLHLHTGRGAALPVYGQVADFTLTNQNGQQVLLANLRGQVWVADVIFTRCAGPCLKMSRQMKELQQSLPETSPIKLVTLTTDPDFDTPQVLKTYAQRFGADSNRWIFLTGPKKAVMDVAVGSLKLTALEKKPEERETPVDLFIHSTIFVLIDKRGQLRGIFETAGEGINPVEVKGQILDAAQQLEREG